MQTFQDTIDLLVDYLGGTPSEVVQRDCRRAILEAYRDLANSFRWSYLLTHGRLITAAPVSTGTIEYLDSAGTYPRQVVLTPAVGGITAWPDWSRGAYLRVGDVAAKVARRVGDTELQLDEQVHFAADLPAGTQYRLYRDSYLLPADFIASDEALLESGFAGMVYVHAREWLAQERTYFAEGNPVTFTVTGDTLYPSRLVLRLAPLPVEARTIDFLYLRSPRPLVLAKHDSGTVSASSGGTTLTGVGTNWTAAMVGSVVRLSGTSAPPTGIAGKNPPAFESVVTGFTSATSIEVADPAPQAFAAVAHTISDRVDVEERSMLNVFNRCCEMHLSR
jgi:hypothetical protein